LLPLRFALAVPHQAMLRPRCRAYISGA